MRVLQQDVLAGVHGRIRAGTAESDLPEGVHIGNPKLWIEAPADSAGISFAGAGTAASETFAASMKSEWVGGPPSRSAAKAQWLAYAGAHGVAVGDSPTKAEIIEALAESGIDC